MNKEIERKFIGNCFFCSEPVYNDENYQWTKVEGGGFSLGHDKKIDCELAKNENKNMFSL